jgi:hypothetical protein
VGTVMNLIGGEISYQEDIKQGAGDRFILMRSQLSGQNFMELYSAYLCCVSDESHNNRFTFDNFDRVF